MLNEATENIKNETGIKIERYTNKLTEDNTIFLELEFTSTNKKKYLTKEILNINNQVISEQISLEKVKAYIKKFVMGKLRASDNSKYFELVQQSKTKDKVKEITKSLKYIDEEINQTFYLSEIDAEALSQTWKTSLHGFSKIKLLEANNIFSANSMYITFEDQKISDINTHVNDDNNPDFLKNIVDTISEDDKFSKEKINITLKKRKTSK